MKRNVKLIRALKCLMLCSVSLNLSISSLFSGEGVSEEAINVVSLSTSAEDVILFKKPLTELFDSPKFQNSVQEVMLEAVQEPVIVFPPLVVKLDMLVSSYKTQTDVNQLAGGLHEAREALMSMPISHDMRTPLVQKKIIQSVQVIESILSEDLGELLNSRKTQDPHASEYYQRMNDQFLNANQSYKINIEYYRWLNQVVCAVQSALANKNIMPQDLVGGYAAYLVRSNIVYAWCVQDSTKTPESFQNILSLLKKDETQNNPYLIIESEYQHVQQMHLDALCSLHPTLPFSIDLGKGEVAFKEFDNLGNGQCGFYGLGLDYDKAIQTLFASIGTKRIYENKYYKPMNRRFCAVNGDVPIQNDRMVQFANRILNQEIEKDPGNALINMELTLKKISDSFSPAINELVDLKKAWLLRIDDHELQAPYVDDIGYAPIEGDMESWKENYSKWVDAHQNSFNLWNDERSTLKAEYEEAEFSVLYEHMYSKDHLDEEHLRRFIKDDFERLFTGKYLDLDPNMQNQSMIYVDMLQNFNNFNIYLWMKSDNVYFQKNKAQKHMQNAPVSLVKSWIVSDTARDVHLILYGEPNMGNGHYKKLVPINDRMGLANALRHEISNKINL
ncbi:MAG: hypothetical protein Q8S21_00405 [Candidatus Paracaedibacteraceae bacterium]|nr:hypothetical protein [Candidatus Paracaedibacteraceae bacterium]